MRLKSAYFFTSMLVLQEAVLHLLVDRPLDRTRSGVALRVAVIVARSARPS